MTTTFSISDSWLLENDIYIDESIFHNSRNYTPEFITDQVLSLSLKRRTEPPFWIFFFLTLIDMYSYNIYTWHPSTSFALHLHTQHTKGMFKFYYTYTPKVYKNFTRTTQIKFTFLFLTPKFKIGSHCLG